MTIVTPTGTSATVGRSSFGLKPSRPTADAGPGSASPPAAGPQPLDAGLWSRLTAMTLDDPAVALPVSKRLAAEHKWTEPQTERAIAEYKRFLYLTQRAGCEVTPSRPVDLVWHEHLMHTRHYWDTLCRDVLQNNLHHNPGTGGATDAARLQSQYAETLQTYRATFGIEPPADIWPAPSAPKTRAVSLGLATVAAISFMFAIAAKIIPLAVFCMFGLFLAVCAFASASNMRRDRGGCGTGCGGGAIGGSGCGDSGSVGGGDGGGGGGGGCGGGGD